MYVDLACETRRVQEDYILGINEFNGNILNDIKWNMKYNWNLELPDVVFSRV